MAGSATSAAANEGRTASTTAMQNRLHGDLQDGMGARTHPGGMARTHFGLGGQLRGGLKASAGSAPGAGGLRRLLGAGWWQGASASVDRRGRERDGRAHLAAGAGGAIALWNLRVLRLRGVRAMVVAIVASHRLWLPGLLVPLGPYVLLQHLPGHGITHPAAQGRQEDQEDEQPAAHGVMIRPPPGGRTSPTADARRSPTGRIAGLPTVWYFGRTSAGI